MIERARSLGLIEPTDDGRFRLPDRRFMEIGATLSALRVPTAVVLEEWAQLVAATDGIADRFIGVFEDHLLPADWRRDLTSERAVDLAAAPAPSRARPSG